MKRSILYILLPIIGLWSCSKSEDTVFEQSADERLNEALTAYQEKLSGTPNGWKAVLQVADGGTYSFFFKFNNQNRVVTYSDFADKSASVSKESSYRLKAVQRPVLIFDTYSYIHVLSDPDAEVNGGLQGKGLSSDFEFVFDSLGTDNIVLTGRMNKSRMILTKASAAEEAAYVAGNLNKSRQFENITKYLNYFKRATINGIEYEFVFNPASRLLTLNWLEGGVLKTFSTHYYYSVSGIAFSVPLVSGSVVINGFDNIVWDAGKLALKFSVNGATVSVLNADRPLKVDTSAPRAWWQQPVESGSYWISVDGFHINGVDDALGVNTIKTDTSYYYYYFYWPSYAASYDAFGPAFVINNALKLVYADAPRTPTFTTDGRVVFSAYATLGNAYPTSGPAVEMAKVLYDTRGFYLVKTSDTSYDMVSARDAKIWISWLR